MKHAITILALLVAMQARAQLSVGSSGMKLSAGSAINIDGLTLTPSTDLTLTTNRIQRSSAPVAICSGNSINRVYALAAPITFSGTAGIYYASAELNGNTETKLQIAYQPAANAAYAVMTNSSVNTSAHYVSSSLANQTLTALTATNKYEPVTITQQPASSSVVCAGSSVSVFASVSGTVSTYQWYKDGRPLTSQTSAMLTLTNAQPAQSGSYSLVATGTCNSVTSMAFALTVNPIPDAPILVTASGGSYPAGVNQLTISQNTGNVTLMVSGCSNGTINWAGGSNSTLAVSTATTGPQTFTATCTSLGCTSPLTTATVTVVAPTLQAFSRDPDNGQLNNNTLKPYLQLRNLGTTPIQYSTITVRYWLTTEPDIPLLFQKNYVQLGSGNLTLTYVPLTTPRQNATGYIEYRFSDGAGSLGPAGDSGPIELQVYKQDYSLFNQLDDYSYVNNGSYTLNPRITVYQNGVIFYGVEPGSGGGARLGIAEVGSGLRVTVLGNPVEGREAEVEISGVAGQAVQLQLVDMQGRLLHQQTIPQAGRQDQVRVPLESQGLLLLQVSTSTQRQQVKLLRR